uniref:Uncharacterized protein n=1 Tax=Oryza meridionalis TaxID=40149 RepID=A0A0E0CLE8_9ORYZ
MAECDAIVTMVVATIVNSAQVKNGAFSERDEVIGGLFGQSALVEKRAHRPDALMDRLEKCGVIACTPTRRKATHARGARTHRAEQPNPCEDGSNVLRARRTMKVADLQQL